MHDSHVAEAAKATSMPFYVKRTPWHAINQKQLPAQVQKDPLE